MNKEQGVELSGGKLFTRTKSIKLESIHNGDQSPMMISQG